MKKELEKLCNDFSSASQLLCIMGRSAEEQSAFLDLDILKNYHQEMTYALNFVADALRVKANDFWRFLEAY